MKGFRFYADLPGTEKPEGCSARGYYTDNVNRAFGPRTTVKTLRQAAGRGELCNVVAVLLGAEHRCVDYSQESLCATFLHADSDVSLCSVSREYLRDCRRIPEQLARQLHPRLFARLDS